MNTQLRNRCRQILLWLVVFSFIIPASASAKRHGAKKSTVKVMTRNLYLGADIFKVVEASQSSDPYAIPTAVAEVYQTMLFTNFWARAEALADEIAAAEPQIIGLQEVSTYYIQTPGDFLAGNPVQASTLVIDFYTVLDAALKARRMEYTAFTVTNADIEMPMIDPNSPTYLSDARLVDHDVILVKKGHDAVEVLNNNYQAQLELDLDGGATATFTRGYLAVDVNIKDTEYRFVNTHLEVRSAPESVFRYYQSLQMQELVGELAYLSYLDPKPVIMVGDFNSSNEDEEGYWVHPEYGPLPYTPPYMQAADAGYLDTWLLQSKYDEGYTSGFDEYVSDPGAMLTTRIDLVFIDPVDQVLDKVKCDVVGDEIFDMIPNPNAPGYYLWPSDHAGVFAKVKFVKQNRKIRKYR
ncbi:MAG: endonuclease/exonuclease/phosphatase family protein [Bacteroidales bacterium]|jgi:endonuclease/exonuclease/phosphatase family metal-dependent hydrolase|nr:endonuclease/exonuclease/phosphatase family protein [Bacteroidales bacterium]